MPGLRRRRTMLGVDLGRGWCDCHCHRGPEMWLGRIDGFVVKQGLGMDLYVPGRPGLLGGCLPWRRTPGGCTHFCQIGRTGGCWYLVHRRKTDNWGAGSSNPCSRPSWFASCLSSPISLNALPFNYLRRAGAAPQAVSSRPSRCLPGVVESRGVVAGHFLFLTPQ